tara:strand:- start:64 stop:243 length:180 start_codon:yes stop_codon:yes gene_type:complete
MAPLTKDNQIVSGIVRSIPILVVNLRDLLATTHFAYFRFYEPLCMFPSAVLFHVPSSIV